MPEKFYIYVILWDKERVYRIPFNSELEQKAALSLSNFMPYEADIEDEFPDELFYEHSDWELMDENYQLLKQEN